MVNWAGSGASALRSPLAAINHPSISATTNNQRRKSMGQRKRWPGVTHYGKYGLRQIPKNCVSVPAISTHPRLHAAMNKSHPRPARHLSPAQRAVTSVGASFISVLEVACSRRCSARGCSRRRNGKFHRSVFTFRLFVCGRPPAPLVEVRIRRGQFGIGALEPSVEGIAEVGGLLGAAGGDVSSFAGVFANVVKLGTRMPPS